MTYLDCKLEENELTEYPLKKLFPFMNFSLPIITPILQLRFLCAQDMRVPVESFSTAITAISTSWFCTPHMIWCYDNSNKREMVQKLIVRMGRDVSESQ